MAGAGYKLFTTGEVLTAAQVNTYLQEQTVMSFADAAARTSALSSVLAEGMMSYLRDTNAVQVYNGSAWVAVGSSSPLTTKGDLYGFSTLDARVPIGTNNQVLTADSAQALGLKWATPSGGPANYSLIGSTALTGNTTITISGISGMNSILALVASASSANAASFIRIRVNGDSGSNYYYNSAAIGSYTTYDQQEFSVGGFADSPGTGFLPARMTNNAASLVQASMLLDGGNTAGKKVASFSGSATAGGGNGATMYWGYGYYDSSSVISSVSVNSSTGNFDNGTLYVYGSA
jgi:hypothetical protein